MTFPSFPSSHTTLINTQKTAHLFSKNPTKNTQKHLTSPPQTKNPPKKTIPRQTAPPNAPLQNPPRTTDQRSTTRVPAYSHNPAPKPYKIIKNLSYHIRFPWDVGAKAYVPPTSDNRFQGGNACLSVRCSQCRIYLMIVQVGQAWCLMGE